jgi:hypothetical protein
MPPSGSAAGHLRVLDLKEDGHVLIALEQQYEASQYRTDDSPVFCRLLGTPLDPSTLTGNYMRPALAKAQIMKPFRGPATPALGPAEAAETASTQELPPLPGLGSNQQPSRRRTGTSSACTCAIG